LFTSLSSKEEIISFVSSGGLGAGGAAWPAVFLDPFFFDFDFECFVDLFFRCFFFLRSVDESELLLLLLLEEDSLEEDDEEDESLEVLTLLFLFAGFEGPFRTRAFKVVGADFLMTFGGLGDLSQTWIGFNSFLNLNLQSK
jgi:hypothetical protein